MNGRISARSALGRGVLFAGVASLALSSAACPNEVDTDGTGGSTSSTTDTDTGTGGSGGSATTSSTTEAIEKAAALDLVFAIDNSRGMADKQALLALAIPDLVKGLVNPGCIDGAGTYVTTPAGPLEPCPDGSQRAHTPILDIHLGVVSSSLGGHGSDACSTAGPGKESNNDRGRLIARLDPAMAGEVETYQGLRFLAWDPAQKLSPPGEVDLDGDSAGDANATALLPSLRDMVLGAGEIGCGYESQLESWYRFLVDPTPPENVTLDGNANVKLEGIDEVLLSQRKTFLRPDSVLAIVMLTDENDCSIKESKQFYYAAQQKGANNGPFHLPKARAICESEPANECCFSCGQKGPLDDDGNPVCPADPTCKNADASTVYLDDLSDNINLRCFDQKRRFGIDFLYTLDRYVDGLTNPTVTDRVGQVVPNPLFSDLDPSDDHSAIRNSQSVVLAGIVGVPWQDIARTNANGVPDVKGGLDASGKAVGGFRTAAEMSQLLPGKQYSTWELVAGNVAAYGAPKDPLMIESVDPRSGTNPITGDPLVSSAQPLGNKINGHEFAIPKRDNLQFACIFPLVSIDDLGNVLPAVRDCSVPGLASCDCADETNDSPVCQVNPATGLPTNQVSAKAYPGTRHLALLQLLGERAVVGSVCPPQLNNPSAADFGYRPTMRGLMDRLKLHFQ